MPDLPGVKDMRYFTSENVFNMTKQPKKMLIVGSGPIGCELGQGFARLGSEVTMLEMGDQFLPRDDADSVKYLQDQLVEDGVKIMFNS